MPPAGLPIEQVLGEYSLFFLRRDVALFVSTRAPSRASDLFPNFPEHKTPTLSTKPIQMILNSDTYRPFEAVS